MVGEHLPSQPDMSKKDAITGVEQETTSNLAQFRNWVTGGLSKVSAMTSIFILTTFNANAQLPNGNDVAKNTPKKVKLYEPKSVKKDTTATLKTEKGPGDPIKNKTEYDAEYARLLKIRKESEIEKMKVQKEMIKSEKEKMKVQKEMIKSEKEKMEIKAKLALLIEQREMLMGCMKFLERIQKQNGVVTEADVKLAKGALEDVKDTKRLPELAGLVASATRIYEYLASQTPQNLYTKSK